MKKQIITGFMALALIGMSAGCGKENVSTINFEIETEDGASILEETENVTESSEPQTETDSIFEGMELSDYGNVTEITEEYITVSLSYQKEDENGMVMVASAEPDAASASLKKVYYTEKTVFKLREVRNSGVDPERDVTEKEADIADLEVGASVRLEGNPDGEDYRADVIYIYHYI